VLTTSSKKSLNLEPEAFQRLLSWLDRGHESSGQQYLEMRDRLVAYFDRKNCVAPDELADETLDRVARRLEEEGVIEIDSPAHYCYITARFVFMEHLREGKRTEQAVEQIQRGHDYDRALKAEAAAEKELRHRCLDTCLDQLEDGHHQIITRYYVGRERAKVDNRRALAQSLGITINALSIRACRIRGKLEKCARECLGEH
jgi:DNA-directed RNA polymerase specialized sigma24 family protein